ncbi:MAG TPA: pantoate--beta-alanine ligase [Phycisphaerae bacterium]|nr:pantoate--beta-alanine ligase [Phycisphaerae bacterium]HPS52751.1 pantoate--beta-alanine ligase [Phycisphaerae bacterium]
MSIRVTRNIDEVRTAVRDARKEGRKVGLVPTMGALHEGHASLVRAAARDCGMAVVSIYLNPTQFSPSEDLDKYPRTPDNDIKLCESCGASLVFMPSDEVMYPAGKDAILTRIEVPSLAANLCGRNRPTHFAGVCLVVSKLFNIVQPDVAYFGQKDYQQAAIIRQMVRDLDFPIKIEACPIVREADGLAMSSRNAYLSAEHRRQAAALSDALFAARDAILAGELPTNDDVTEFVADCIRTNAPAGRINYVQMVDAEDLHDIAFPVGNIVIAVAVKFGQTRLIDNIYMELP